MKFSSRGLRVRSPFALQTLRPRGADSPDSTIRFAGTGKYSVLDFLDDLYCLAKCSSSKLKDKKHPPTTDPTSRPKNNNSSTHPTLKSQKVLVGMNADYCEALVDELMSIVDFGEAINEPYIEIAGERCLNLIRKGVIGGE